MFGDLFYSSDDSVEAAPTEETPGYVPPIVFWPASSVCAVALDDVATAELAPSTVLRAGGVAVVLAQSGDALANKGGVCWGAARGLCALLADVPGVDFAGKVTKWRSPLSNVYDAHARCFVDDVCSLTQSICS